MKFFKKKDKPEKKDDLKDQKNWFNDRYQVVIVQRNFLAIVTLLCLAGVVFSVFTVVQVTTSKTIEPFVIEVEERTGITNVIRPFLVEEINSNEAIRRYFVDKYIRAREEYYHDTHYRNYYTVVRLLSTSSIYNQFRALVDPNNGASPINFGRAGERTIAVISRTEEKSGSGYKLDMSLNIITKPIGRKSSVRSSERRKRLVMEYQMMNIQLTPEEREINPLGFQVTSYRIVDEFL